MRSSSRILAAALVCGALCAPLQAHAVNLVPNDSFELYASCPTGFSQFYQCVAWNLPNAGTSDLLNACSPTGFPSVNVPYNTEGQQAALTGVGYAGIIVRNSIVNNDYREYLQVQLASPLVNGTSYQVEFHVSLADTCDTATDRLGAYLSVGAIGPLFSNTTLLVTPQVESPALAYLTDKTNWTTISGTYVATGGEDHIIIGSFHDDATTNSTPSNGTWPGTYYYVDDVSVTQLLQACCSVDGYCQMMDPTQCSAAGWTPLGVGSVCGSGPCGPTSTSRKTWGGVKTIYR